ncbi:hypothetical protein SNEBB_006482, partial [Seison nebaliae]
QYVNWQSSNNGRRSIHYNRDLYERKTPVGLDFTAKKASFSPSRFGVSYSNKTRLNHQLQICHFFFRRIYNHNRTVENKKIKKTLGEGGQGVAYLVENILENRTYVYKLSKRTDWALFESNALYAFDYHPIGLVHNYKRIDLTKGADLENSHIYKFLEVQDISYIQEKRTYCLLTTFVPGEVLKKSLSTEIMRKNHNLRPLLTFLIYLLRQIQAVHFTLNRDPIFNNPILGQQSYANAHADLHGANILMTPHIMSDGQAVNLPIAIDYAYGADRFYGMEDDIVVDVYNKIQRNEAGMKEENHVHRNRIFNYWQNIDFCEIVLLITKLFFNIRVGGPPMRVCINIRIELNRVHEIPNGNFIRHLKLFNLPEMRGKELLYIILAILQGVHTFTTYQYWLHIYKIFNPNNQYVNWQSSNNGGRNIHYNQTIITNV